MVYSRRTLKENTVYLIKDLEPHKHYTVSVKVISDSMTSEAVVETVVTMIDRESGLFVRYKRSRSDRSVH